MDGSRKKAILSEPINLKPQKTNMVYINLYVDASFYGFDKHTTIHITTEVRYKVCD